MFHRHSSVAAIQQHMRGIEYELRRLGKSAGRQSSTRVVALRDQIADIVTPILNEVADLMRNSPRLASQAARLSEDALKVGARLRNDAADRVASEIERRPLMVMAVILGVGILIGLAGRQRLQG